MTHVVDPTTDGRRRRDVAQRPVDDGAEVRGRSDGATVDDGDEGRGRSRGATRPVDDGAEGRGRSDGATRPVDDGDEGRRGLDGATRRGGDRAVDVVGGGRRRGAVLVALAALSVACAVEPAPEAAPLVAALPDALTVDCAQRPDLQARLWVSGYDEPCALDVDLDENTTTGACDATAGATRRFTLDWYVERAVPAGDVVVVLAQAQKDVAVSGGQASLSFATGDVRVTACEDMAVDSYEGATTVDVDGVARPVCDLDGSCGADEAAACANVGEVCAGEDPLLP